MEFIHSCPALTKLSPKMFKQIVSFTFTRTGRTVFMIMQDGSVWAFQPKLKTSSQEADNKDDDGDPDEFDYDWSCYLHLTRIKEFDVEPRVEFAGLAAGVHHAVAWTKADVYTWSVQNDHGQLGKLVENNENFLKPTKVVFPEDIEIASVNCGAHFTILLEVNGRCWAWGDNRSGQCGTESDSDYVPSPTLISKTNLPREIKQIQCGYHHTLALTSDGCVFAWGCNQYGQLGFQDSFKKQNSPKKCQFSFQVSAIACGSEHSLVLNQENSQVWSFGRNHKGQCGDGAENNVLQVVNLFESNPSAIHVFDIYASGCTSIAYGFNSMPDSGEQKENACCYIWGQLRNRSSNKWPSTKLPRRTPYTNMQLAVLKFSASQWTHSMVLAHVEGRQLTRKWQDMKWFVQQVRYADSFCDNL